MSGSTSLHPPPTMKKEDQKSIKSNLNLLATKTKNFEELITALEKRQLIEEHEKSRLEKLPTKHKRCSELYLLMLTKGPDAFELLHQALVESGNDRVADILKPDETTNSETNTETSSSPPPPPPTTSQVSEIKIDKNPTKPPLHRTPSQIDVDVEVKENHVRDIVDVLDRTIDHFEWPLVVIDLLDSPQARQEIDNLPSATPYEVLFEKTLQLWIKSNGPNAKFNVLLKVLHSRKQVETAEALKKQHLKIFGDQV